MNYSDIDIENMAIIMEAATKLRTFIDNVIEDENHKMAWHLAIAADFLHDLPEDLVNDFFETYDIMREEVNFVCGS